MIAVVPLRKATRKTNIASAKQIRWFYSDNVWIIHKPGSWPSRAVVIMFFKAVFAPAIATGIGPDPVKQPVSN